MDARRIAALDEDEFCRLAARDADDSNEWLGVAQLIGGDARQAANEHRVDATVSGFDKLRFLLLRLAELTHPRELTAFAHQVLSALGSCRDAGVSQDDLDGAYATLDLWISLVSDSIDPSDLEHAIDGRWGPGHWDAVPDQARADLEAKVHALRRLRAILDDFPERPCGPILLNNQSARRFWLAKDYWDQRKAEAEAEDRP